MSGLRTWLDIETKFLSRERAPSGLFVNFVGSCFQKSVRIGDKAPLPLPGVLVHINGNDATVRVDVDALCNELNRRIQQAKQEVGRGVDGNRGSDDLNEHLQVLSPPGRVSCSLREPRRNTNGGIG